MLFARIVKAFVYLNPRLRPHHAAFCICTVPARTLTKIKFIPSISDDQWDAAKQLQYARIMKTVLLFKERFWMGKSNNEVLMFHRSALRILSLISALPEGAAGILSATPLAIRRMT